MSPFDLVLEMFPKLYLFLAVPAAMQLYLLIDVTILLFYASKCFSNTNTVEITDEILSECAVCNVRLDYNILLAEHQFYLANVIICSKNHLS